MIVTEKQAADKWCPMGRDREDHYTACIASGCMAWRWIPLMADDAWSAAVVKAAAEIGDLTPSRVKAAKHVNANRAQYGLPTIPFTGYCGMAGPPPAP